MNGIFEFSAVLVVFLWSVSVWSALLSLSPGRTRKVEELDRNLAASLEKWLELRREHEIILRFIIFFTAGVITVHGFMFYRGIFEHSSPYLIALLSSASTFLLLLATEISAGTLGYFMDLAVLRISMPILSILRGSLFLPVVASVMAVRRGIDSLKNSSDSASRIVSAEDEILSLVESGGNPGQDIEESEKKMIKGVFNLDDKLTREIMTPRVDILAIPSSTDTMEARRKIIETGHSRMPVYDGSVDRIAGILYAKDLLDEKAMAGKKALDLARPPLFVPENKSVMELLEDFKRKSNHFAVVVDEYGGTAGIVTFEDVIEQIVGEIGDEYDTQEDILPDNTRLPDGSVLFDGRALISEANAMLDANIEEYDGIDTVGGHISAKLGRIPEQGEKFDLNNSLQATILKADKRKILRLKISRKQ